MRHREVGSLVWSHRVSDGAVTGPTAGSLAATPKLLLLTIVHTFGCRVIISNEVFPYVVEASEVHEGH